MEIRGLNMPAVKSQTTTPTESPRINLSDDSQDFGAKLHLLFLAGLHTMCA
jgi:hypothetical protein